MRVAAELGAWSPAAWSAIGVWATFGVYVALLAYAVRQFGEARRLREAQVRPFVVVDFKIDWLLGLMVENTGSLIARDVQMVFDPPLTSTFRRPWPWEESPLFSEGIPTLAPGRSVVVPFDSYRGRSSAGLDMVYSVTVTYSGLDERQYEDTYTLDLGVYEGTSPPEPGIPDVVKALDKMQREFSKWTDGLRGLRVNTRNADRAIRREARSISLDRARAIRSEQGPLATMRHIAGRFAQNLRRIR